MKHISIISYQLSAILYQINQCPRRPADARVQYAVLGVSHSR
jgi:hypothetical protein